MPTNSSTKSTARQNRRVFSFRRLKNLDPQESFFYGFFILGNHDFALASTKISIDMKEKSIFLGVVPSDALTLTRRHKIGFYLMEDIDVGVNSQTVDFTCVMTGNKKDAVVIKRTSRGGPPIKRLGDFLWEGPSLKLIEVIVIFHQKGVCWAFIFFAALASVMPIADPPRVIIAIDPSTRAKVR